MPSVSYDHEIEYGYDPDGNRFPFLSFQITSPTRPEVTVDIDAFLNTGAQRSLFSGRIGKMLGINILDGPKIVFQTMSGSRLTATLHLVRLLHPELGVFELEVSFSTAEIERNVLGRDFFNLVQIGFRERHLTFYITAAP